MQLSPAVFLDRDGTIIDDVGYLHKVEDIAWKDGAFDALRSLASAGYLLVLITNQSGVGRGYFPEAKVGEVHDRMQEDLACEGISLAGIYYCPHAPEDECSCRKPGIGMLVAAAHDHTIDAARSWFIGDTCTDMAAGNTFGARTVLIGSLSCQPAPTYTAESIAAAAAYIRDAET